MIIEINLDTYNYIYAYTCCARFIELKRPSMTHVVYS